MTLNSPGGGPCLVSQETGKMVWYSHLFKFFKNFLQFVVIHAIKGFNIVNEPKADVFLEFPCFLCNPTNVGNLISGCSAFSTNLFQVMDLSENLMKVMDFLPKWEKTYAYEVLQSV